MNIFKLRRDKEYKNDKIKIYYSTDEVSNQLSAYLYDSDGKAHHVYWNISPDRCGQSFDKTNEKVKSFILGVVEGWLKEQEISDKKRIEIEEQKKKSDDDFLKSLNDNF